MKTSLKAKAFLIALAFSGTVQLVTSAETGEAYSIENKNFSQNNQEYLANELYAQRRVYRVNDDDVEELLDRLQKNTDNFQDEIDKALDDSRLDGSDREDKVNDYLKDFEKAVARLRDRFDDDESVTADVQEVLNRSLRIDNIVQKRRLGRSVEQEWAVVRQDINELARISAGVVWRPYRRFR